MFKVSGLMSMKTGTAPRMTKELTVVTKVKEGTITSSPGLMSQSSADISRAAVQECVRSAALAPDSSISQALQSLVYLPSPERCKEAWASAIRASSRPVM